MASVLTPAPPVQPPPVPLPAEEPLERIPFETSEAIPSHSFKFHGAGIIPSSLIRSWFPSTSGSLCRLFPEAFLSPRAEFRCSALGRSASWRLLSSLQGPELPVCLSRWGGALVEGMTLWARLCDPYLWHRARAVGIRVRGRLTVSTDCGPTTCRVLCTPQGADQERRTW